MIHDLKIETGMMLHAFEIETGMMLHTFKMSKKIVMRCNHENLRTTQRYNNKVQQWDDRKIHGNRYAINVNSFAGQDLGVCHMA